ncbi:MAG: DUF2065 domain-containing protein [Gammaproteobacteria bacterium]
MAWSDLFTGLSLLLIFEGLMPFIFPTRWKNLIAQVNGMSDAQIRVIALISIILGLLLLTWIRH